MLINAKLRGCDPHGCGHYGAPRGSKTHRGLDIACIAGSEVLSVCPGVVTKIGYPYDPADKKKGHLRYVQVTDVGQHDYRYFYINPGVSVGDNILALDVLGTSQGLTNIYPGITDHFHFEVKRLGKYLNPNDVLQELDLEP